MTIDLRETRLPGIGVKYAFTTARGARLVVILHNDGEREVYWYRRRSDDEPRAVIELHDDEARELGALLGGAFERPKIVEDLEMALGELLIEWIPVPEAARRGPVRGRLSGPARRACVPRELVRPFGFPQPVEDASTESWPKEAHLTH